MKDLINPNLDLTKLIIEIIQAEKVVDIEQKVRDAIPVLGVNDNGTSRPESKTFLY